MKLEIKSLPKAPREVAQVGDIFTYTHPDTQRTVRGLIISPASGEYCMLNLDTMRCGSVTHNSADALFVHYKNKDFKEFTFYPKGSWQSKIVLEEIKQ